MINQLFFIMADNDSHDGIGRLLTYLNYRFGKAMWYPIPPGEWDLWGSAGPETELGTALRILRDKGYSSEDVSRWLSILSDSYMLDTSVTPEDVTRDRMSL